MGRSKKGKGRRRGGRCRPRNNTRGQGRPNNIRSLDEDEGDQDLGADDVGGKVGAGAFPGLRVGIYAFALSLPIVPEGEEPVPPPQVSEEEVEQFVNWALTLGTPKLGVDSSALKRSVILWVLARLIEREDKLKSREVHPYGFVRLLRLLMILVKTRFTDLLHFHESGDVDGKETRMHGGGSYSFMAVSKRVNFLNDVLDKMAKRVINDKGTTLPRYFLEHLKLQPLGEGSTWSLNTELRSIHEEWMSFKKYNVEFDRHSQRVEEGQRRTQEYFINFLVDCPINEIRCPRPPRSYQRSPRIFLQMCREQKMQIGTRMRLLHLMFDDIECANQDLEMKFYKLEFMVNVVKSWGLLQKRKYIVQDNVGLIPRFERCFQMMKEVDAAKSTELGLAWLEHKWQCQKLIQHMRQAKQPVTYSHPYGIDVTVPTTSTAQDPLANPMAWSESDTGGNFGVRGNHRDISDRQQPGGSGGIRKIKIETESSGYSDANGSVAFDLSYTGEVNSEAHIKQEKEEPPSSSSDSGSEEYDSFDEKIKQEYGFDEDIKEEDSFAEGIKKEYSFGEEFDEGVYDPMATHSGNKVEVRRGNKHGISNFQQRDESGIKKIKTETDGVNPAAQVKQEPSSPASSYMTSSSCISECSAPWKTKKIDSKWTAQFDQAIRDLRQECGLCNNDRSRSNTKVYNSILEMRKIFLQSAVEDSGHNDLNFCYRIMEASDGTKVKEMNRAVMWGLLVLLVMVTDPSYASKVAECIGNLMFKVLKLLKEKDCPNSADYEELYSWKTSITSALNKEDLQIFYNCLSESSYQNWFRNLAPCAVKSFKEFYVPTQ